MQTYETLKHATWECKYSRLFWPEKPQFRPCWLRSFLLNFTLRRERTPADICGYSDCSSGDLAPESPAEGLDAILSRGKLTLESQESFCFLLIEKKLRILMVEDGAGDAVLVEHALKQGSLDFCLRRVETREAFLQELNRFNPSVILSDHGLPSFDGFAALSLARKKAPEVPFIFVTGSLGEEMTIKALKSGAADFILKHRLEGLPLAVQRALRQIELRQERRKAEEALHSSEERYRRLSVELEKRVAVRTRELEAANEELEAFSYSVSHDLRAPLRHIKGYVEILMATKVQDLDEESRKHLGSIADSAQQMGRLLDGLLTFSRAARAELRKTRFQLSDLVKACIRDFEHETGKRKVEWVVGELPEVCADPALLRQVMVNLLNNALKYTRPREVARIEVGCCSDSEAHVLFVRDNGVGFDPRYAEKLFGMFQRLHLAADFEGTGVGLANVRRIISRHGGRTWAEGQTDKGATFYFTMPKAAND